MIKIRTNAKQLLKATIKAKENLKRFLKGTAKNIAEDPRLKTIVAESMEVTIRAQKFTPLSDKYAARKGTTVIFLGTKREQMTKALFKGQGLIIKLKNNNTINIGFNTDTVAGRKASRHQKGNSRLPQRKILKKTIIFKEKAKKLVSQYIVVGISNLYEGTD